MTEPHWIIVTLLGAIVGYLLPHGLRSLVFFSRFLIKNRIEGHWWVYHTTRIGRQTKVIETTWMITAGYFNRFSVRTRRDNVNHDVYRGSLIFERNYLLVKLSSVRGEEEAYIRIYNPIATNDTLMSGLFLSVDYDGNAIAGPVVLSRNRLAESAASEYLASQTYLNTKTKIIALDI